MDSFTIFKSFQESRVLLSDKDRLKFDDMLFEFGINGKKPKKENSTAWMLFNAIMPGIEKRNSERQRMQKVREQYANNTRTVREQYAPTDTITDTVTREEREEKRATRRPHASLIEFDPTFEEVKKFADDAKLRNGRELDFDDDWLLHGFFEPLAGDGWREKGGVRVTKATIRRVIRKWWEAEKQRRAEGGEGVCLPSAPRRAERFAGSECGGGGMVALERKLAMEAAENERGV